MAKKLIFLDIDGTITMPGVAPSGETVSAIRAARKNGHLVFLCTGRSVYMVDEAVSRIGFDGGIYHAGGKVLLNGEPIVDAPIPTERVQTLVRLLTEQKLILQLEAADTAYCDESVDLDTIDLAGASTELLRQIIQRRSDGAKRLSDYRGAPIYKIGIVSYSPRQREALTASLPQWAKLVWFANFHRDVAVVAGEISDDSITKATAMDAICRRLGYGRADCIAFGDSMNDAEILERAGIGVAMGNADDEVKRLADVVCESCQENGIAKEFRRMNLI